jgi:hypothetical protein
MEATPKVRRQIRVADVATYRAKYTLRQKGCCALCETPFGRVTPSLDHCHKNGMLRAALCRSCNTLEGSIRIHIRRQVPAGHLSKTDEGSFYVRLGKYLLHHAANPSGIYHHSFDPVKGKQKPVKRAKKRVA